MYSPMIRNEFKVVQGGGIDSRLNHYFLEHSYKWAMDSSYDFELWSPPFYYPAENMLALSDNLLGSAPIYWLLRSVADPTLSYQLWLMGLSLLSFLSMFVVCRALKANWVLSLAGAYLFAFGLAVQGQIGHPQLLGQFFAPPALYFLVRFLQAPSLIRLGAMAVFSFLQLMAGVYLGWFLFMGIGVYVLLAVSSNRNTRERVLVFLRTSLPGVAAVLGVMALITVTFMAPYLRMSAEISGGWGMDVVEPFLHPVKVWVLPNPQSLLHGLWMPPNLFPPVPEGAHTLGVISLIFIGAMGWIIFHRNDQPLVARFCLLCLLTVLILVTISVTWPFNFSFWSVVYRLVPGAKAIRAVNRIWVVVYLFLIPGGVVALSNISKRIPTLFRIAMLSSLAVLVGTEQIRKNKHFYNPKPEISRSHSLAGILKGSDVGYIVASPDRNGARELLDAMWAGLISHTPVVNGTSSRPPPGYPENVLSLTTHQIQNWITPEQPLNFRLVIPKGNLHQDSWVDRPYSSVGSILSEQHTGYREASLELPLPVRYGQRFVEVDIPETATAGKVSLFTFAVQNTGSFIWKHQWPDQTQAAGRWIDAEGTVVQQNPLRTPLPRPVLPGEWIVLEIKTRLPEVPGQYSFEPTMVRESVAWFYDQAVPARRVSFNVTSVGTSN